MMAAVEPKLYVGTYGKYNSGSIEGEWLTLSDYTDKDDFLEACAKLHSDESDPEFMYQDFEGFPRNLYSESGLSGELFKYVQAITDMSDEEREAFDDFMDNDSDNDVERFKEAYQGHYDSMTEFAEHLLDDIGDLQQIPERLRYYFDFEAYARDLELGGDYWISDNGHVFNNHV
jgi:antirestriction protein